MSFILQNLYRTMFGADVISVLWPNRSYFEHAQPQEVYTEWYKRTGGEYIAHCISPANVLRALTSGKLRCAEEILRNEGQVETKIDDRSGCTFARMIRTLVKLDEDDFHMLGKYACTISVIFSKVCKRDKSKYHRYTVESRFAKDNPDGEILVTMKEPDKNPNAIRYTTLTRDFKDIYGARFYKSATGYGAIPGASISSEQEPSAVEAVRSKHSCSLRDVIVAYDEARGRPFYRMLNKIYEFCLRKGCNEDELHDELKNLRERFLHEPDCRLQNDISTLKNSVFWNYGDIAIIKGNFHRDVSLKAFGKHPSSSSYEHRTLAPYQNRGMFYTLDLTDPDLLILGPKKMLDSYRKDEAISAKVKARFVDIESLTSEQKAHFAYGANG